MFLSNITRQPIFNDLVNLKLRTSFPFTHYNFRLFKNLLVAIEATKIIPTPIGINVTYSCHNSALFNLTQKKKITWVTFYINIKISIYILYNITWSDSNNSASFFSVDIASTCQALFFSQACCPVTLKWLWLINRSQRLKKTITQFYCNFLFISFHKTIVT